MIVLVQDSTLGGTMSMTTTAKMEIMRLMMIVLATVTILVMMVPVTTIGPRNLNL